MYLKLCTIEYLLMVLNCQSFTRHYILFLLLRCYIVPKQATNKYFPDYASSKRATDVVINLCLYGQSSFIPLEPNSS